MKISSAVTVRGDLILPGDKSISHRAAIFSALAEGRTRISNFGTSADCAATVRCLQGLGVNIVWDGTGLLVNGVGKRGLRPPGGDLDCENSGTTMRLMAGVLAGQDFESVLTGDESLQKRPMKRVIDPLVSMGAAIGSKDGRAPLSIKGKSPLKAINYEPSAASAQLKSCVLLAGLNAEGETSVLEKTQTRDHTERMFKWLGVDVREEKSDEGVRLFVSGDAKLTARDIFVPSDLSSAAFFIVAAAFLDGSELSMPNVGFNPSRKAVVDVLKGLGIDITASNKREVCNEPVADLTVKGSDGGGKSDLTVLSGEVIANLIDEIPILAVAGSQMKGGLEVRDARELRIKESDRIDAIVENLRRMGASIEEFDDGFRVERSHLKGAVIDSFGDHRIAMSFAVAGLFAEGETEIIGAESAAVSFPAFFDEIARVIY
ncbi:MAG: 3-phosphoshikimate 1-carboxyvinyltransferase [Acidobacteria bacterium]|nr:3-phosphoshikimate 1-carboxyvinyltransferase [Acidobacteriota bacterium]